MTTQAQPIPLQVFVNEFQQVWDQVDPINFPKGYQDDYMLRLLHDTAGLGACKMMRRVIGLAGVADIRGIEDVHERAIAGSLALNMAIPLLKQRESLTRIEELVEIATACKPTYPWR